jgi:hypothetical protein
MSMFARHTGVIISKYIRFRFVYTRSNNNQASASLDDEQIYIINQVK